MTEASSPELATDGRATASWHLDISGVRPLLEAAAAGLAQADWADTLLAGTRVADVNQVAVNLVGPHGGHDQMIGASVADFWPTESSRPLAELIAAVTADPAGDAVRSRPINSLMFRDAAVTVRGVGGEPDLVAVAVTGVLYDTRSRWLLRASEERYRKLIHFLPVPLLQVDATAFGAVFDRLRSEGVTDLDRYLDDHPDLFDTARQIVHVTEANLNAARLFGAASPEDLVRPVDFLFTASPATARRVMAAHFDGQRSYAELIKLRTLDNRLLDVRLTVTYPTPPERLDVTFLTFEDVTDRLKTEAQLRQAQADYTRAARISTLGELATSIAHEVSQPLSAIVTNAETSLRWLARDEPNLPKVAQLTTRIADNARRASDIVQRIRGMAARNMPERVPIDLNEIIDEALHFVRHDVETRSIDLLVERRARLPLIAGDRVQLQQVVVNLLLNSIQAIAQHSRARGRIELFTDRDDDAGVMLSIRDNGLGIAAEHLDRIFEGFFTTKHDGMGMGLAICQSIIAAHGGTVAAGNHSDGGAQFRIRLPATPQ